MTARIERVVVVIPARDEADTLSDCLASVRVAARVVGVPTSVVLVLDSCRDSSAEIAASFPDVHVSATEFANVGRSRAWGVSHAPVPVDADPETIWLATTDADSAVPSGWLAEHLRAARGGADAFIGAVVPVLHDLDTERRHVWMRTHPPGATVGHVHGANLGLRLSAYRASGGFTSLETGEDVDIVGRLRRRGMRITASDAHPVVTSSRLSGRVRDGYAQYLVDLAPGLA